MAMIQVVEVTEKGDLKKFVQFPFAIYKGSKYWVPPIIKQELDSLDKNVNPAFLDAEAHFFLAYKNNQVVGRLAAIINWIEVNEQKIRKIRFGWFDVVDDIEVSKALLSKVAEIGRTHELSYMEGPMGFSSLDKVGVLTEGYDHIGTMITWYNYPYYVEHLKTLGFIKEKEFLENKFYTDRIKPAPFFKAQQLIERRYGLNLLIFKSTSEILPLVDKMFDLYNKSYASLASFVPISDIQREYFKKNYISFINPEYIVFVEDKNHELVAFAVVMPSFSKALQKAKGKLFPFGFLRLLHAKKNNKTVNFYLIGVHPQYQNKGVTAIIFSQYYRVFMEKGITTCIRTPELAENKAIYQIWRHFDQVTHAKRATYKKSL